MSRHYLRVECELLLSLDLELSAAEARLSPYWLGAQGRIQRDSMLWSSGLSPEEAVGWLLGSFVEGR